MDKLVSESLAIEVEEAKDAGAIGYMARALVQATLPHSKVIGNTFSRSNGLFKLAMMTNFKNGLPYGSIPRLLLAWMATEAIKTKDRNLLLGSTLTSFMKKLDLIPKSGRLGTIARFKDQMQRLFSSSVSCTYDDGKNWAIQNVVPVSRSKLWWNPVENAENSKFFESTVTLNGDFFNEIINNPTPVDVRVLKALKRSPLALDIYCWLTYRMSYLKKNISITWSALQLQFGTGYPQTSQGLRDFKKAFVRELCKINLFYPQANIDQIENGLVLKPSKSNVSKLIRVPVRKRILKYAKPTYRPLLAIQHGH